MPQTSGFEAFSIYDPATGTVVQVDQAHFSSEAQFTKEEVEPDLKSPSGAHAYAGHHCLFEADIWTFEGAAQLRAWAEAGTPVCAVAAGTQRNLQWYEPTRLHLTQTPIVGAHGETNRLALRMERTAPHPAIYAHVNLLAHLAFEDSDGDGLADGYESSSDATPLYTDGSQRLDGSTGQVFAQIVFPVAASGVTASVRLANLPVGEQAKARLQGITYGGLQIEENVFYKNEVARFGGAIDLQAQTWSVKYVIIEKYGGVVAPALRTDGSEEYVPY